MTHYLRAHSVAVFRSASALAALYLGLGVLSWGL